MTSAAPTSSSIECGLRGLGGLAGCTLEEPPRYFAEEERWAVRVGLRCAVANAFIASTTQWYVLLDKTYPYGRVKIRPAVEGGLSATFPHQSRNVVGRERRPWRQGELCLDTPFGGDRHTTLVRDPLGDADQRLRWHVERALSWLNHAANGELLGAGEPFELPAHPLPTVRWSSERVIHDECRASFAAWSGRAGTFGVARFGALKDLPKVVVLKRFEDADGNVVREWSGRELTELEDARWVNGFWFLWPSPIVLSPWQAPTSWRELVQIAKASNISANAMFRWLLPRLRGLKKPTILMLGYPVPLRVGDDAGEVHWDALLLPRLNKPKGQPRGFRPNARGWMQHDREGKFADSVPLEYVESESWNAERLQARGRLPQSIRDCRFALLGVGALGSVVGELLVRAGVKNIALFDDECLVAGNINRHIATLSDVGAAKVAVVAQRLRQLSPSVDVVEFPRRVVDSKVLAAELDPYDVIVDCTSADSPLAALGRAWWSVPRVFASFSLGFGGERLFSFGVSGNRFPDTQFEKRVRPWLDFESSKWANREEVLEGPGCWSPLFPARHDDVVLAAAVCVKELELLLTARPTEPRFRVFAQSQSIEGFQGFVLEKTPPTAAEARP